MKPKTCAGNRVSIRVVNMPLRPVGRVREKRWFKYVEMFIPVDMPLQSALKTCVSTC